MIRSTSYAGARSKRSTAKAAIASATIPLSRELCIPSVTGTPGLKDGLLAIDTPVVDSEGCLAFEVGIADKIRAPASETLKPVVSAILTEAFLGTSGPMATGVLVTIPAAGQTILANGIR